MMYEVNIFLTNRYVPIPEVLARERLLVDNAGASGFYHVIARPATSPWKKLPTTCLCMACLLRGGKIACQTVPSCYLSHGICRKLCGAYLDTHDSSLPYQPASATVASSESLPLKRCVCVSRHLHHAHPTNAAILCRILMTRCWGCCRRHCRRCKACASDKSYVSRVLRMLDRYGYVERIRQGGEFVAALLDRVIGLLLKSLQEQLAQSATLRADLGFTDIFPVPVRFPADHTVCLACFSILHTCCA